MRCDNAPAPWSSDESGDPARLEVPADAQKEIDAAVGKVHAMGDAPYWDCDPITGDWGWAKAAPPSQKSGERGDAVKKLRKQATAHERLLKDFGCGICKKVLEAPLSMPCGHNFCKGCLDAKFAGQPDTVQSGFKSLRARKVRALRVTGGGEGRGPPPLGRGGGFREGRLFSAGARAGRLLS